MTGPVRRTGASCRAASARVPRVPRSSLAVPPRSSAGVLLGALLAAGLIGAGAAPASAATLATPAPTLGVLGGDDRLDCANPVAATTGAATADLAGFAGIFGTQPGTVDQVAAALGSVELLPALTICSPTFAGVPAPFEGTVASAPSRSRVGTGWRELGGTLVDPAALAPGDAVTVPQVDDAASLRVALATQPGNPATTVVIGDLAPGPSRLAIGRDARGVVATLTRADGTTTEAVGQPPVQRTPKATISGSARRWTVRLTGVPGTIVVLSSDGDTESAPAFGSADRTGRTSLGLRLGRKLRPGRAAYFEGTAASPGAQTLVSFNCRVRVDQRSVPSSIRCSPEDSGDIRDDFSGSSLGSGLWDVLGGAVRSSTQLALRAEAARASRAAASAPVAHRNAVMARSSAPAGAPITARPIPLAATIRRATLSGLRPFAADLNGDGQPDFWTDRASGSPRWWPTFGGTAGLVLISSPAGLSPHRVELAASSGDRDARQSELSAIDDITGDGVGELVIDLDERHAIVPGSRAWTSTTSPIRAPGLDDLGPTDLVVAPAVSSPGNAYGALDDSTGDGLRELAATDDLGGWTSVSPRDLTPGRLTRLATPARIPEVPAALQNAWTFDPAVPRVDPRTRIIAGRAISLRWPKVATEQGAGGIVELTIRDARGVAIGAPTTVSTPGNALLLDHDRATGDALLLAVEPACVGNGFDVPASCREHLMRVRADGTLRQRLATRVTRSIDYLGGARFIDDGPDADADADVVYPVGNQAIAAVDSARAGIVGTKTVPHAGVAVADRPFYEELRLVPVMTAGGKRRLTLALPERRKGARDLGTFEVAGAVPTEIVWQ